MTHKLPIWFHNPSSHTPPWRPRAIASKINFTVTIRQVPVLLIKRPDAIRRITVNNTTSK